MGRSRGGLTSKIHALVDAEGRPVSLRLTGGQIADCTEADALTDELGEGDKGRMAATSRCNRSPIVSLSPRSLSR